MRLPIFVVAVAALSLAACSSLPDAKSSAALGIAAGAHALDFVAAHTPPDDVPALARVERVRAALASAAKFVDGEAPAPKGVAALAEALAVAELAVTELEADGVRVPREVKAALAAARGLIQ
jgi:hypothetical protein